MSLVKTYLLTYNVVSAFLWICLLGRLLLLYPIVGAQYVGEGIGEFARQVQSLAILEVGHSLFGLVKAPVFTTLVQVSSRILLVWGILYMFPEAGSHGAFSTMILAWSLTESIRYSYHACKLQSASKVPGWLTWLRYNTFFVLYPLGATSEMMEIYVSLDRAYTFSPAYDMFLKAALLVYIPGFSMMFTHMMSQRRRAVKNVGKQKVQ